MQEIPLEFAHLKPFNKCVNLDSISRLAASLVALGPLAFASGNLDVHDFGAKGDGAAKDTASIQAAIDKLPASGGTVVVSPGTYLCGTIHLRSNLTLRIEQGATLLFSKDDHDFDAYEPLPYHLATPPGKKDPGATLVNQLLSEHRRLSAPPAYDDVETTYFHYALLSGDGVHNVTIEGNGTIEGNRPRRGGPKPIAIKNSEWITVRGITIRNAPNYNISFGGSDHIEVDSVKLSTDSPTAWIPTDAAMSRSSTAISMSGTTQFVPRPAWLSASRGLLSTWWWPIVFCALRATTQIRN